MMSSQIPISLRGKNLGERHCYLNHLVIEAYSIGDPFESIIALPELSPVDRLFKIDLASKHKHVEYTLKNLQDDDMLYVSRALKSKWLLDKEYHHIINPAYLEDILYPHMITTAVNKMKHWINLNLRDSVRSQEFYEYYSEKDGDYALKFLRKCPEDMILKEFVKKKTLSKITPQRFKILCEKTSSVAKIFFDLLLEDKSLCEEYIANAHMYIDSLKYFLKTDPDLFLDIIEQHFMSYFKRLGTISTKFIMTQRKDRFMQKPELYTSRILNVETLAHCLSQEECAELVIKLARAWYLANNEHWFDYKNIEPLIKRLDVEKRASLKKKVFVDKDFGEPVTDWPYAPPKSLVHLQLESKEAVDVFLDDEHSSVEYHCFGQNYIGERFLLKKKQILYSAFPCSANAAILKPKTLLDSLFDEYRFTSFDKTLFELRKKITSESLSQNRMYMMLVLVSKSGGKTESLNVLLQLLIEHRNAPCQVRAAVIRSLVKKACVWRVTEDIWKNLLIFGQGLGLDGTTPEADCNEGLHAVVIRTILSNRDCDPAIKTAFIKNFSPLNTYSLTAAEKQLINEALLNMLLDSANVEVNVDVTAQILQYVLDTLQAYNTKFETRPEIITGIKNLVKKDHAAAKDILKRLFDSKLGRKELFYENFDLIQTDASYFNALKHDITILSVDRFLKAVVCDELNAEKFLKKITIYFRENEGLTSSFLTAIEEAKINKKLARPLAYLLSDEIKSYILELDANDMEIKRFSALIRANAHVARPAFSIDGLELRKYGAKLIANRVLKCKAVDIDRHIKQLLTWRRTVKLAIILAQRTNYEADVFAATATIRPTVTLKSALTYFRRRGYQSDLRIWETVKPLIVKINVSIKASRHLLRNIGNVESIPLSIRPEYATETFKVIKEIDFDMSLRVLHQIMLLLPKIDEDFVEAILCDYMQNRSNLLKKYNDNECKLIESLFLRILVKFLLLCKTEEIQNRRFEKVGQLYFNHLRSFWESAKKKTLFFNYLHAATNSFKCSEAFLNEEYVSCLPVMEKFIKEMQTILPMEKYFGSYVSLHLNMLFYKSIRQAAKQMPEILADKEKRRNEGHKVVGKIFGKYVCHESRVLIENFFDSVIELYGKGLVNYMHGFNIGRFRMIPYIIKSIIEDSDGIECTLALILYNDNKYDLNNDETKEILNCMKRNNQIEMQFLLSDVKLLSR